MIWETECHSFGVSDVYVLLFIHSLHKKVNGLLQGHLHGCYAPTLHFRPISSSNLTSKIFTNTVHLMKVNGI
jgi:hypothetical protein